MKYKVEYFFEQRGYNMVFHWDVEELGEIRALTASAEVYKSVCEDSDYSFCYWLIEEN